MYQSKGEGSREDGGKLFQWSPEQSLANYLFWSICCKA